MTKFEQVVDIISERNPLQQKMVHSSLENLTQDELMEAERSLNFFINELGSSLSEVADAYMWFVEESFREQILFMRSNGTKYLCSSFAETSHYYTDNALMRNYVVSLATSLYLFPQHIGCLRFFKDSIKNIRGGQRQKNNSRYLEIGPGHGHLLVTAMENSDFESYTGVDISMESVEMTRKFVHHCLPERGNCNVINQNFFDFDSNDKYDAIVMGEVLEHVETPEKFLLKISNLASDNAFIYISTAVNAPWIDHIYLFKTVEEVEDMFNRCGLYVKDKYYGVANGADYKKAVKNKLPIVPAYILGKA